MFVSIPVCAHIFIDVFCCGFIRMHVYAGMYVYNACSRIVYARMCLFMYARIYACVHTYTLIIHWRYFTNKHIDSVMTKTLVDDYRTERHRSKDAIIWDGNTCS